MQYYSHKPQIIAVYHIISIYSLVRLKMSLCSTMVNVLIADR